MSRTAGGADAAALTAAARELDDIGRRAREAAARFAQHRNAVAPAAHAVDALIAGTETGVDKRLISTLHTAGRALAAAEHAAAQSSSTASKLAAEAMMAAQTARANPR